MKLEKSTFEEASKKFPCFDFELVDVPQLGVCKTKVRLDLFAEVDIARDVAQVDVKLVASTAIGMVLNKFLTELKIVVPILEKRPSISTEVLMEKLEEELGIKK